jgi:hypothetical protein
MTKFQGQTDKVLKVKLTSALVSAQWGLAAVAQGGRIPIEVQTQFVADGSDIKITIKDLEGAVIEALEGQMYSNYHRAIFALTKPNKTGGMSFEAELSAHSLKAAGPKIRVMPPIKIDTLKWLDDKGKALTEVTEGPLVELTAKVQGAKDGDEAYIRLQCRKSETEVAEAGLYKVKVMEGKISVKAKVKLPGSPISIEIQKELEKLGLTYFPPQFFFEAGCFGVTADSEDVKLKSMLLFDFAGQKGKAILLLPDGTEETKDVPADGILRIEEPKIGRVTVADFIPDGKDSKYAES